MRLCKIPYAGDYGDTTIKCSRCNAEGSATDYYTDLDRPAFSTYYCRVCRYRIGGETWAACTECGTEYETRRMNRYEECDECEDEIRSSEEYCPEDDKWR
jgi:hypothetical protein